MARRIIKRLNMAHKPQPFWKKQTIPDGRVWVFVSGFEPTDGTWRGASRSSYTGQTDRQTVESDESTLTFTKRTFRFFFSSFCFYRQLLYLQLHQSAVECRETPGPDGSQMKGTEMKSPHLRNSTWPRRPRVTRITTATPAAWWLWMWVERVSIPIHCEQNNLFLYGINIRR